MLLKKLQSTKSTVSNAQGKSSSGGGIRGSSGPVPRRGGQASAPVYRRPEWIDPTATSRPQPPGYAMEGTGDSNGSGNGRRSMFRGAADLKEVALQACPDKHTLL
jgi:hypothetical protein